MPITDFQNTVRPNALSLNAAYRPIVFQPRFNINLSPFPPVVFCDVYFNGGYYETLTSTTYLQTSVFNPPYWKFDIQSSAQKYLKSNLPVLTGTTVGPTAIDLLGINGSSVNCMCKFRVSSYDANGFIVPEGANGSGGFSSPSFYIINSVLQHEDNQDLKTHLSYFKKPVNPNPSAINEFIPLSHRSDNDIISKYDYDHFPFFTLPLNSGTQFYSLGIKYKKLGDTAFTVAYTNYNYSISSGVASTLPSGIIQLKQLLWYSNLLPVTATTVPFDDIAEYSLFLLYNLYILPPSANNADFNTPLFKTYGCGSKEGRLRIRFLNALGFYDSVNFSEINGTMITSSEQWQKALNYPLNKSDGGMRRMNLRSNEQFTISTCDYPEDKQEWLKELFDTPDAYIEWPGTQGQGPANIPILIKDGEQGFRKQEGRYEYVTQIVFTMSNENIRQRI